MYRQSLFSLVLTIVASAPLPAGEIHSSVDPDSIWNAEHLTGNWWGRRPVLEENGVDIDIHATQFYQGVADGGRKQDYEYGGKIDYLVEFDAGKAGLQQGFFIQMHAETRIGTDVNNIDGLIAPANISMNFPDPERDVTSITGLKFTQALSENFAIYAGKINTFDEYPIRFVGGPGLGGFMNTSLVFNPIMARTIPYSALGVGAAVLQNGEPLFTLTALDPEERATDGISDPYARGVTLVPDLTLRLTPFGLPGIYNFGGTYSTADYVSVDPASYLNLPFSITGLPTSSDSWSLYSNFYQALWVDPCDSSRSWGLFGQFGISDGDPNPIRFVANGGIAGHSMIPGRNDDRFGAGFFYLGLSDDYKTLSIPILAQRDEYGIEAFYNYALTPWCMITSDLQVARPSTIGVDTVIITGTRMQLIF